MARLLQRFSYQRFYHQWLKRRNPPRSHQILNRKTIFILPSRTGFGFLVTVILLWLLGTNYQNNLVLVMSFLLLSLLHTCIFYTYRNLSGLVVEFISAPPCFMGERAQVKLVLHNKYSYSLNRISVGWMSDKHLLEVDIHPNERLEISIPLRTLARGWQQAERISLSSVYPLGLIKAWSHLDLAISVLVYPQPIRTELPKELLESAHETDKEQSNTVQHNDAVDHSEDVSHLREYHEGDSPKHIAWKHYAKGQGLATKVYESEEHKERQQWLRWDDFSGFSTEGRLSRLCDCVLQADAQQLIYGLVLPHHTSELSAGVNHQQRLLQELALFNVAWLNNDDSMGKGDA